MKLRFKLLACKTLKA